MDQKNNPLKTYLEERGEGPYSFARRANMNQKTIYNVLAGRKPQRSTALRICRNTQNKLTLADFGFNRK